MREGLRANRNPADFHLYQPNMNAIMPRRGPNSHYSRPVTLSTLFGVKLDAGAVATTASALRIVPGLLRTVPLAPSGQVTSADGSVWLFVLINSDCACKNSHKPRVTTRNRALSLPRSTMSSGIGSTPPHCPRICPCIA